MTHRHRMRNQPVPSNPNQPVDPDQYESPSGEELLTGALADLMAEQGINPLGRASSPSEPSTPSPRIPNWFQRLSDNI